MSVSISPSGTLIAIGYGFGQRVILYEVCQNQSSSLQYYSPPDVATSAMVFGRSAAWLDNQGTLAVLVEKATSYSKFTSEIHIYKNISFQSGIF